MRTVLKAIPATALEDALASIVRAKIGVMKVDERVIGTLITKANSANRLTVESGAPEKATIFGESVRIKCWAKPEHHSGGNHRKSVLRDSRILNLGIVPAENARQT